MPEPKFKHSEGAIDAQECLGGNRTNSYQVYDPKPKVSYPAPPKGDPRQNDDEAHDNENNVSEVNDSNDVS